MDVLVVTIGVADVVDGIDELKLFACRVREAIARETLRVRMLDTDDEIESGAEILADVAESAMRSIRRTLIPAADLADPSVAETAGWVDEHLSNVLEVAMVKLVKDLSRRKSCPEAIL